MTSRYVVTTRYANYRMSFDVDDRETRATVNSFTRRRDAERYAAKLNAVLLSETARIDVTPVVG